MYILREWVLLYFVSVLRDNILFLCTSISLPHDVCDHLKSLNILIFSYPSLFFIFLLLYHTCYVGILQLNSLTSHLFHFLKVFDRVKFLNWIKNNTVVHSVVSNRILVWLSYKEHSFIIAHNFKSAFGEIHIECGK